MTPIIPSDIDINDDIVKAVLLEQFDLSVSSCHLLGAGWDNQVYLINNALVFRFPRRLIAVELIEREIKILSKLAAHVTLNIPKPTYIGKASAHFARPFYGHAYLGGKTGCSVNLSPQEFSSAATTLGQFLRALHGLDIYKFNFDVKIMTPVFDRVDLAKMKQVFLKRLDEVKKNYDIKTYQKKIFAIVNEAQDYEPNSAHPCLIHGDLYHRHLLFDDQNRLTSIIDWGDAGIGDHVADLGVVFQFFPPSQQQDFWLAYGDVTSKTKKYARFLGLYSAIALLWFGHDRNDKNLISTSLWTINNI